MSNAKMEKANVAWSIPRNPKMGEVCGTCYGPYGKENSMVTIEKIKEVLDGKLKGSAWKRGVREYADELLDSLEEGIEGKYIDEDVFDSPKLLEKALLNGAEDWNQYSWGGCSLVYDGDIAERLCSPSMLRKYNYGNWHPGGQEWLDIQKRALGSASRHIKWAVRQIQKGA